MSRILQSRRSKMTPQRQAPMHEQRYDEMKTTDRGENVIDMSKSKSTAVIDKSMLRKIKELNTDTQSGPAGEEIYEGVFDPTSSYQQKLIKNMINDLQKSTKYLYADDGEVHSSYEAQVVNPSAALSNTKLRQYIADNERFVAGNTVFRE